MSALLRHAHVSVNLYPYTSNSTFQRVPHRNFHIFSQLQILAKRKIWTSCREGCTK